MMKSWRLETLKRGHAKVIEVQTREALYERPEDSKKERENDDESCPGKGEVVSHYPHSSEGAIEEMTP